MVVSVINVLMAPSISSELHSSDVSNVIAILVDQPTAFVTSRVVNADVILVSLPEIVHDHSNCIIILHSIN